MREGGPIMRRQGAPNWRAIACPPLDPFRSTSRPERIERAYFYGGFGRGVAVTVTEFGGCCDPVVIEKLLDPCSGARVS